ncbi:PrpF domain-containing protein [Ottowia thiooxydans]|uniref:PrpF domain-containing protein n=1 Tax=Ottowia thiooxydans TaxID=219182 RepID=UPI0004212600|nr:PrpF domain-containing protein [Ottowia thiooxydans]
MSRLNLPRLHHSVWEFPVHYMRGGTSTGLLIWEPMAPAEEVLREELLGHMMGVATSGTSLGNKQITGLGRGSATSNKVFFADVEPAQGGTRLVSTLAQLAADHSRVDWSVNCGNMSSALQLWALHTGLLETPTPGLHSVEIRNTNTGVLTTSRMAVGADHQFLQAEIPGVMGHHPAVDLFLHRPAGAKTGLLLPTGNPVDIIDSIRVSCVDVAVPMVIARAQDFGKTGHESINELAQDSDFMARLKRVWVEAGLRMKLRRKNGELMSESDIQSSETIPKVCIISAARMGADLSARYFTPQTGHASLAVSGGCCLAVATLIPGSVAHELAPKRVTAERNEISVNIENPAGILSTKVVASLDDGNGLLIESAAYQRSAQILLSGYVPLYNASLALRDSLEKIAAKQLAAATAR